MANHNHEHDHDHDSTSITDLLAKLAKGERVIGSESDRVVDLELDDERVSILNLVVHSSDPPVVNLVAVDSPAAQVFANGKTYRVCNVSSDGMCVMGEGDNHVSIPIETVRGIFRLRVSEAQDNALREYARLVIEEKTETLIKRNAEYEKDEGVDIGDIVTWKDKMATSNAFDQGEPALVVEKRERAFDWTKAQPSNAESGEYLDVVLAVVVRDGNIVHLPGDSRRLRVLKKKGA